MCSSFFKFHIDQSRLISLLFILIVIIETTRKDEITQNDVGLMQSSGEDRSCKRKDVLSMSEKKASQCV